MKVILKRESIEMGAGADGPRMMAVYTIALPRFKTVQQGRLMLQKEADPLVLPYIIWPCPEQGRIRFRWARRHRGKPEMRLGIETHGAKESLEDAIEACIDNHRTREHIKHAQPRTT